MTSLGVQIICSSHSNLRLASRSSLLLGGGLFYRGDRYPFEVLLPVGNGWIIDYDGLSFVLRKASENPCLVELLELLRLVAPKELRKGLWCRCLVLFSIDTDIPILAQDFCNVWTTHIRKPKSPLNDAIGPAIMENIRVLERSSMARATRNKRPGAAETALARKGQYKSRSVYKALRCNVDRII